MKKYTFFIHDYFNNSGNYLITGKHYSSLLHHCFQYGYILSLVIHEKQNSIAKRLESWRITSPFFDTSNLNRSNLRYFYYVCKEVYDIIASMDCAFLGFNNYRTSVFWDDPIFLRKDGSIFFEAFIHDGEYSIYPQQGEDVSQILEYGHWLPMDEYGVPEVSAQEHQLQPIRRDEIECDSFYLLLRDIQTCPHKYLNNATIGELSVYIKKYHSKDSFIVPFEISAIFSFLPHWYRAFELYVLGELKAMTNSSIFDAFTQSGYSPEASFTQFFSFLDSFIANICL